MSEVALAVVLTLGAGLLLRSFLTVLSVDPGFRSDNLLTLQITVPPKYQTPDQRRAFYADLFARARGACPASSSVGGTTRLPLGSTNVSTRDRRRRARHARLGEWPEAEFRRAVHNYFAAMGIPVIRGRGFSVEDGPAAPPVVVINQTMARQMFAERGSGRQADPAGRRRHRRPSRSSA